MAIRLIVLRHLNLASADARPHDDVGELHQVQDVPLVTAQAAHCLSLNSTQ